MINMQICKNEIRARVAQKILFFLFLIRYLLPREAPFFFFIKKKRGREKSKMAPRVSAFFLIKKKRYA